MRYQLGHGGHIVKLWKSKRDLLVEETLAFVQEVASAESHREVTPRQVVATVKSVIQPNLPKPKDRLFKDEELEKRLSEFKAVQQKFERERDEYFKATMAKIRSGSTENVT
jgi:hypothetical protein